MEKLGKLPVGVAGSQRFSPPSSGQGLGELPDGGLWLRLRYCSPHLTCEKVQRTPSQTITDQRTRNSAVRGVFCLIWFDFCFVLFSLQRVENWEVLGLFLWGNGS